MTKHLSLPAKGYEGFLHDLKERIHVAQVTDMHPAKQFVQQVVAQIAWGHKVRILDVISDRAKRESYTHRIIAHGCAYERFRLTDVF